MKKLIINILGFISVVIVFVTISYFEIASHSTTPFVSPVISYVFNRLIGN